MPSERLAALAMERVERIMALKMSFSRREAWDHAVLQYILDAQEERERRLEQMPSDKQRVICKIPLPCDIPLLTAILRAMPMGTTMGDMQQHGDELWIYGRSEEVGGHANAGETAQTARG